MKQLVKLALINTLCLATLPAVAADPLIDPSTQENSANTQSLVTYLKNLGAYLGYDLTTAPSTTSTQLIDPTTAALAETYLFTTFFGALPVPMASKESSFQFIPSSANGARAINETANLTFTQQQYSSPDSKEQVTVNSLTDQQPYQNDPVSQSIYNILGTPDVSFCSSGGVVSNPTNPNATNNIKASATCNIAPQMFQNQIIQNVLGPIPGTTEFFSYQNNSALIAQLNSDALIAPLYYSTDNSDSQQSTGSPSPTPKAKGLSAQNQAQQAANFIRYVSGSVVPITLPSRSQYDSLYSAAIGLNDVGAQAKLSTYLTNLRVYAAQTSVGMSNLYYILSKRLPQAAQGGDDKAGAGANKPTSEALNEYNMATWRIFKQSEGAGSNQQQWIDKINTASPATVQKEIAVLLSEINYQLYLTRQINERMLFTSSVSLLQGTKANQPSADLNNQEAGAASATPGGQ